MAQVIQSTKLNKYHKLILDLLSSRQPLEVIEPAIQNYYAMLPDDIQAQVIQETNHEINFLRDLQDGTYQFEEAAPVAAIEAAAFDISKAETVGISNNLPASYSAEIDPVLGQWAIYARVSVPFAQWAILREIAIASNDNYISRNEALDLIQNAKGDTERNASQILQQGNRLFWDYDESTARYYIRAEHVIAIRLARRLPYAIVQDNLPGNFRYRVDLQGSKERINARIYAAWMYSKSERQPGRLYHAYRDMLCDLFNVSKVTLLRWEEISNVKTRVQYERSTDTSFDNVPKHAYLRLGDDGKVFAEWQLPNAYYPPEIDKRAHRGSSSRTRAAILEYLQTNEPDSNGVETSVPSTEVHNVGLQKLGRQYFEGSADNWTDCDKHLRKHQDPFTPHWYRIDEYIVHRDSVGIFARYNPETNAPSPMEGVKVDYRGEHAATFKAHKLQWGMELVEAYL